MDFIVIVEPFRQQGQDGFGVWQDDVAGVTTLQGFDDGLGDTVALRRADRGEGQSQAQPESTAINAASYTTFMGTFGVSARSKIVNGRKRNGPVIKNLS